jgi:thymidylate synthase
LEQAKISAPNTAYRDLLTHILQNGEMKEMPHMNTHVLEVLGYHMRFRPAEAFPLITERNIIGKGGQRSPLRQALGELSAFLNGAHTQTEFESYGCYWWDTWVTEEKCSRFGLPTGELGDGSYGRAWRSFPTADGAPFDQFMNVLEQMRQNPTMRTHRITNWVPQTNIRVAGLRQSTVVAPCHGELLFEILVSKGRLNMVHKQRSADVPVGLAFNLVQYGALLLLMAQALGLEPGELVYWIDFAHIYECQIEHVKRLLTTEPQPLPTATLDPTVKDVFSFRPEHLQFKEYKPQLPFFRIPAPV